MKQFWVNVPKWDKNTVTTAIESSVDALVLPKGYSEKAKELGKIKTVAEDGDLKLGKDVLIVEINSKEDEIKAAKLGKTKILVVKTKDWHVIPLENLVAQTDNLIAEVKNAEDAKLALEILEKGVQGVMLTTTSLNEIKATAKLIKESTAKINLAKAEITSVEAVGSGDRVCIDTCTNMKLGQGMLVGDSSSGMFLVHSESVPNPYVEQRPFRVNAGAVHAYIRMPENKTNYLSELKTGGQALVVDYKGNTSIAVIGRTKTEVRPLMLIKAVVGGMNISLILQNAETIRLVKPNGKPVSVVKLKKGNTVLAFVEASGRHFGMKIQETIKEK